MQWELAQLTGGNVLLNLFCSNAIQVELLE